MQNNKQVYLDRIQFHLKQMKEHLVNKDTSKALESFRKSVYNRKMYDREIGLEKRTPKEIYKIALSPTYYADFFSKSKEIIDEIYKDKDLGKRFYQGY